MLSPYSLLIPCIPLTTHRYFRKFTVPDFANAGHIPQENVVLEAGSLPFPVSMMSELRKMGMVVEVDNGTLVLRENMTVAFEGVPLTPEQAKILTKLDKKLVNFKINLVCRWEDGSFHEY